MELILSLYSKTNPPAPQILEIPNVAPFYHSVLVAVFNVRGMGAIIAQT